MAHRPIVLGGSVYLKTSEELALFVKNAAGTRAVGIDTEFMRERTYYARLCLVQISLPDATAIIDPLTIDDLGPLFDLLRDRGIVKVFHAGSQDLEIFFRLVGEVVAPVFDTQIAATLAGFPQQVGYGALVKELLGVTLDKGDTFTDWARRPLSATQIEYAHNDVRYLLPVHDRLLQTLERDERLEWLERDFARMEDPATYLTLPEEQWRRLKRVSALNRRQLGIAREIAAWRELEAQRRDVPKRWLLSDESAVEISRRQPRTPEDLAAVRGVKDKLPRSAYTDVLNAVERGIAVPDGELPILERKRRGPAVDVDGAVDLMVALVRLRARQHGVAMPILASRDDLERLAAGETETSALLEGWRREIVGEELLALLDGRVGLAVRDGALVVEER
jgi:ribonuclease D